MSDNALPATVADVPTPCLLVDIDKVKRNCQRMIDTARNMGVQLRPHIKTHKSIEGADIATAGTRRKIVVSTLNEAEFFAANGYDDILYGFPISKENVPRCQKLTNQLSEFHIMYDSVEALQWVKDAPLNTDKKWSVILKIDTGYGRAGVVWDSDDVITVAKAAVDADNVKFLGIYTHCGSSYDCTGVEELKKFGATNTDRLITVRDKLKAAGIACETVGTGSTPSCSHPADNMAALTEFHPGTYFFCDYEQVRIGACTLDDVAVRVATRVVSHKPSKKQLVTNSGHTSLSHCGQKEAGDEFCVVQGHPNLRLVRLCQEHGMMQPVTSDIDYPLGTMLFVYPYSSGVTAAHHPVYYVHSGEKIVGMWRPTRGW
ncbi:D-threo-3-hydroxyaspartate dehydratase-like isoform X2 [Haliotis rubra]|uniref:D-threo-3-hydroxyaspartate dehydratase-like isoform X2 n=1 Tax=Haliotis rubra TaxID=36100 RepID=UPI001EE54A6F|nr:D-threo-3-hydroxyaspartate dehydratase-like isoform X2 [Haliotis rubra]